MSYSSAEVKSGILVTVSLIFLLVLTFIVGGFLRGETRTWQVDFTYLGGLEINAPVSYAGTEVGKVDKIEIRPGEAKPVRVTFSMDKTIEPRKDSEAFVDMLGMMGEKILEVTPGMVGTPLLESGQVIAGTDPIPMYLLIQKMNLLADRMDDLTTSLNPMMQRIDALLENHEKEIGEMISNISEATSDLSPLIKRLDKMLARHQEEIARIIGNFEETSANVRDMTHDLKYRPWRLVRKGKVEDDEEDDQDTKKK